MANITTRSTHLTMNYRSDRLDRPLVTRYRKITYTEPVQPWRLDILNGVSTQAYMALSRDGFIRGQVQIGSGLGSVVVPYAMVYLYDRVTGTLIAAAKANAGGAFVFSGLDRSSSNYFACALDAPYNAQIFDKIVPLL